MVSVLFVAAFLMISFSPGNSLLRLLPFSDFDSNCSLLIKEQILVYYTSVYHLC